MEKREDQNKNIYGYRNYKKEPQGKELKFQSIPSGFFSQGILIKSFYKYNYFK